MKHLILILSLIVPAMLLAAQPEWQPARTWVFAVGVLKFDNPNLATWPDEVRVDAVMLDAFRQRGVPDRQIVFIKNEQATKAHVTRNFDEFLRKPGSDDMLVLYYAGHGGRAYNDAARTVSFKTYDTAATWSVGMILDSIESRFKGSRVLLTADCCHSGGLADEAAKRRGGRISYAALTSAQASARSTGNWTFTQSLADLLRGNALLDLDANGDITFSEAARYAGLEMAFRENQRAGHLSCNGFPGDLVISRASSPLPARVGERIEGFEGGKWWKAKIIEAGDGRFKVTWIGWDKKHDSWLRPDQMRPCRPKLPPDGTPVEIEWNKTWYKGRVLRNELGLLLVHYDGYPAADDEWVPPSRVRE